MENAVSTSSLPSHSFSPTVTLHPSDSSAPSNSGEPSTSESPLHSISLPSISYKPTDHDMPLCHLTARHSNQARSWAPFCIQTRGHCTPADTRVPATDTYFPRKKAGEVSGALNPQSSQSRFAQDTKK